MARKAMVNPGWFRLGFDPRRHRLTTEERRRGAFTMLRRWYFGYYSYQLRQVNEMDGARVSYDAWLAGHLDRPGRARLR